ncbi:hypothetical protein VM1G_06338 [Cytospora mali]|uniref:ubiquitinyl hydrolase 1 n=1 Tax=Cytospora mali TaxID=578113 RepID=A0A194W3N4_CYTMA|nr:hypothetical protein VM1G_06338 [Valsa mali]
MAGFSLKDLEFFRNHLFLPPGLPQEDDQDVCFDDALLRIVLEALNAFGNLVTEEQRLIIDHVIAAISMLQQTRSIDGEVNEKELLKGLMNMSVNDNPATIPLYINAQNAGVIFSRQSDGIQFESFEVSPENSAAMSTQGRLRRCFPGPLLCIKKEHCKQPELLSNLANTLSKLSFQKAGMTPKVRKSQNKVEETRDTTHPGLISELVVAFLQPVSSVPTAHKIWKNTREEVLWKDTLHPWRRSPLWLLLRTVMQLLFTRFQVARPSEPATTTSRCLYKPFMIYLLATVLSKSISLGRSTEPDIIFCMSAKIHRRMLKLNSEEHEPGISVVQQVQNRARHHLEQRWLKIQELDSRRLSLDQLTTLEFKNDVSLSLPGIDDFLSVIPNRKPPNYLVQFSPPSSLLKVPYDSLPQNSLSDSVDTYMFYNLNAFEHWVASTLFTWLADNLQRTGTCAALKNLMHEYHSAALQAYTGNPETSSIMILTLLELWFACDKSAVALFPMLVDYNPGIKLEPLQSLLLPSKGYMVRLLHIEEYVKDRQDRGWRSAEGSIFRDFGLPDCFSVRYFDESLEHQDLLLRIQRDAEEKRKMKREELAVKKTRYETLMHQYDESSCDYYEFTDLWGIVQSRHSEDCCKRHSLRREAEKITIDVHEWPLPLNTLDAKSVVFELDAPEEFCSWRDATIFLLLDVLGAAYDSGVQPVSGYRLDSYTALQNSFRGAKSRRLGLLSTNKPHVVTHRNKKFSIPDITESSVCLNNGLRFHYHDASLRSFVDSFSQSDAVSKMCTYQLGKKASALQPFLFPRFEETASTPNEVISSQSECPPHLSLDEYRCLCGIPIGYRLQWMDILRQLAAPSVDWKKPETSLVIFQSIYQAGPQDSENFHRAAHLDLVEDAFTSSLLFAVDEAIGRIKENWESYQALSVFSCIVTRQLSLSPSPQLTARALTVLSRLREVAFDWLELLRTKCDDTEVEVQRRMFAERIVVIALICSGTFDVDDQNLELILSDDGNASILIQCGILIHELAPNGGKPPQSSKSRIQSILRHRWQRLSYRAYPILSRKVAGKDAATCLDLAVMSCWPVYRRLGQWETVVDNVDYWVVSNTLPDRLSGQSLKVHYNLLTGDLRVNGERLSRLPKQYEQHNSYLELFGSIVLQIMPSSVSGMKFSSKQCYAGYSLHFGMSGSNLLVRAIKDNGAFELVPKELIRGKLPTSFVDGFVHWYNMTADTVEFRPKQQPWTSASDTWILSRDSTSRAWKLSKKEHVLINPTSRTGEMLAGIFSPLQEPLQINITLAANGQTIHVELPRLKLEFSLEKGGSSVLCHQFQGLEVDSEQFIGSLIGLKNKLVLRNARTSDRRVIIPAGNVSFERNGDHVSVCIDPSPTSTHIYRLDNIMRLLRDNGNLQSQLFLCYLHAVTSFCLPDSLTDRTGTEQALSILKSKAVKSSPFLTKENMDLLKKIEALTPKRSYYPPQLQVMQTVDWDPRLPVLGQHPQFHECVVALWSQSKATKIYYKEYVEPPKPSDIHPILLRRDSLRSSTFRMSGFGAEEFSDALDSTYRSRDRGQSSERSKRAGLVATMLFHRQPHLQYQVSCFPSFTSHFLHLLRAVDVVMGPNNPDVTDTTLNYDGKWLKGQQDHWAGLWCWLHRRSRPVSSSSLGLHQVMMWFATMAFSSEVDMNIIQAAASMFCLPKMQDIQPPSIPRFSLNKGDVVKRPDLGTIIRQHCLSFIQSLDANLPKLEWESNTQWRDRRQAQYISNRDSAINKLIEHLASQWPCLSPAAPSGDSGETIWQYVKLNQVMVAVKPLFETWYENLRFRLYIQEIEAVIDAHSVEPLHFEVFHFESPQYAYVHQKRFISAADLFASSPPDNVPNGPKLSMKSVEGYLRNSEKLNRRTEKRVSSESKLKSLIQTCEKNARSPYERKYANDLRESYESLELLRDDQTNTAEFEPEELRPLLEKHLSDSVGHAANIFETMRMTMHDGLRRRFFTSNLSHGPRVSPVFLLRQLSHGGWDSRDGWDSLPATWKQWIVYYGLALTEIQRAKRLINSLDNSLDLLRELKNEGHTNWDATEYPDSLLIEIENDIMIRKVQEEIAAQMRSVIPRDQCLV